MPSLTFFQALKSVYGLKVCLWFSSLVFFTYTHQFTNIISLHILRTEYFNLQQTDKSYNLLVYSHSQRLLGHVLGYGTLCSQLENERMKQDHFSGPSILKIWILTASRVEWEKSCHFRPELQTQFLLSKREQRLQKYREKVARSHFGQPTVTSKP